MELILIAYYVPDTICLHIYIHHLLYSLKKPKYDKLVWKNQG